MEGENVMAQETSIFRKQTMERISSPEQLTDYLRVTNPGIWVILASVLLLLVGLIAWSTVGTLETKVEAKAVVQDHAVQAVPVGADAGEIRTGLPLRMASREFVISSVDTDQYGRTIARTEADLPDGTYDAEIVVEQIHPIGFLLESR